METGQDTRRHWKESPFLLAGLVVGIVLVLGLLFSDMRSLVTARTASPAQQTAAPATAAAKPAPAKPTGGDVRQPLSGADAAAKSAASPSSVKRRLANADYERARWDPIHFKPVIDHASNEACLVCHQEILSDKPRATSPAGVKAEETLAWYQTLDTYDGAQASFHWRHLQSPFAKQVMNLSCTFCHQGADPREKAPHVTARTAADTNITAWRSDAPAFTLRKTVNPSETCLRCHGSYPAENMGLSGTWAENREALENPEAPNGCLSCHAEQFRTVRHQVNYLNADGIEKAAEKSSDACYGCHGGRQWYRISYPYPRHDWPNMPDDVPDWAKDRPKESDARFRLPAK